MKSQIHATRVRRIGKPFLGVTVRVPGHAVLNLSISNALGVKKQIRATRVQIRC